MSRIFVTWDQNSNYDSFDIYRSTSPIDQNSLPTPLASGITNTYYSDTTVVSGQTYFYRIKTNLGVSSVISDEFSIKAEQIENPSPFNHDKVKIYMSTNTPTTTAGWQKVNLDSKDFDTNAIWDSVGKRIKPKKAGYYSCNARVRFSSPTGYMALAMGRNGENYAAFGIDPAANSMYAVSGSMMVYCNGSTDYLDLRIFSNSVNNFSTGSFDTYLEVVGPF